jgi:hypothetical protein
MNARPFLGGVLVLVVMLGLGSAAEVAKHESSGPSLKPTAGLAAEG